MTHLDYIRYIYRQTSYNDCYDNIFVKTYKHNPFLLFSSHITCYNRNI